MNNIREAIAKGPCGRAGGTITYSKDSMAPVPKPIHNRRVKKDRIFIIPLAVAYTANKALQS
jgi:hypothetical protein